jgi:hypothetical protein
MRYQVVGDDVVELIARFENARAPLPFAHFRTSVAARLRGIQPIDKALKLRRILYFRDRLWLLAIDHQFLPCLRTAR